MQSINKYQDKQLSNMTSKEDQKILKQVFEIGVKAGKKNNLSNKTAQEIIDEVVRGLE